MKNLETVFNQVNTDSYIVEHLEQIRLHHFLRTELPQNPEWDRYRTKAKVNFVLDDIISFQKIEVFFDGGFILKVKREKDPSFLNRPTLYKFKYENFTTGFKHKEKNLNIVQTRGLVMSACGYDFDKCEDAMKFEKYVNNYDNFKN